MTREEFTAAVNEYADTLFRASLSVTGNREDAEDAMQEALLKLWHREGGFESPDHMRYWLIRVAINEAKRAFRWRKRVSPLEELGDQPFETPEESGLYEAVMSLPEKYRVPVFLHYYEGMSVREIAGVTASHESTVQTRLSRARAILEKTLREDT